MTAREQGDGATSTQAGTADFLMPEIQRQILSWLAGRDTGLSSKSIAFAALGIEAETNHPHDPADLGRCLRLLERVPALKDGFAERMSALSPTWSRLVQHWDELDGLMREEVGIAWEKGRSAPRTYQRMHQITHQEPRP